MSNLTVNIKITDGKARFEGVSDANPNINIPFNFAPRSEAATVLQV